MIYFLQRDNGDIKIGTTRWTKARISSLQAKHGKLRVLGVMEGSYDLEKEIHKHFAEFRIGRSEWFRPVVEIHKYIARHADPNIPEDEPTTQVLRLHKNTHKALRMFGAEFTVKTGHKLTDEEALIKLLAQARPDIMERVKREGLPNKERTQ